MRSAWRPKSHTTFSLLQGAAFSGFTQSGRGRSTAGTESTLHRLQKIQNFRIQEPEFVLYEVQLQTQTKMLHSSQEKNSVDPLMGKVTCCSQCDKQRGKWSISGEAIAAGIEWKVPPFSGGARPCSKRSAAYSLLKRHGICSRHHPASTVLLNLSLIAHSGIFWL